MHNIEHQVFLIFYTQNMHYLIFACIIINNIGNASTHSIHGIFNQVNIILWLRNSGLIIYRITGPRK